MVRSLLHDESPLILCSLGGYQAKCGAGVSTPPLYCIIFLQGHLASKYLAFTLSPDSTKEDRGCVPWKKHFQPPNLCYSISQMADKITTYYYSNLSGCEKDPQNRLEPQPGNVQPRILTRRGILVTLGGTSNSITCECGIEMKSLCRGVGGSLTILTNTCLCLKQCTKWP